MKALVCSRLAPDYAGVALVDVPVPRPGPGEVAIAVRAAALNYPDLMMTRGTYQHRPTLPYVVGLEGAGVVTAIGAGVGGLAPGDPVCFSRKEGAIAEHAVMPAAALRGAPPGFDWGEAAAFYACVSTAWVALVVRGQLRAGETLLVHGASGGTGVAAVQLGLHLGARVIATGRSESKLAPIRALGAETLLLGEAGFRDAVKSMTGGRGADVVFDPVGGDVFDASTRCIAPGGRLLVIGFTSGRPGTLAANLALIKMFSMVGVRAGEYLRNTPDRGASVYGTLLQLAMQGVCRPLIGARYPLSAALDAMRALDARAVHGKIVVDVTADAGRRIGDDTR